jgi:phage-related protein
MTANSPKPVVWLGSSQKDLREMPEHVRSEFGHALYLVQDGDTPAIAKPLKGFGGGVLELVEGYDGDAYRAAYATRLAGVVYVLHVFQKKSKTGIATPKPDLELIRSRLRAAEVHYAKLHGKDSER